MRCHPDLFPNDKVKAKEFVELQSAYEKVMNWEREKPHFEKAQFQSGREEERKKEQNKRQERPNVRKWAHNKIQLKLFLGSLYSNYSPF